MTGEPIRTEQAERRQVAALPWRRAADGSVEILMITSRETRRWVTPKGGRMPGKTDAEAAAQEAWEEAGITGQVEGHPFGTFRYLKRLKRRAPRWCVVAVHPLAVETLADAWPEAHERERRWMSASQAAESVDEPDLADLIRAFARDLQGAAPDSVDKPKA